MTECLTQISFGFHGSKPVEVSFDAPDTSSDGGLLLVRQLDDELGVSRLLSEAVPDERDGSRTRHSRLEQVRQRLYQIAAGYEDCNDADRLRHDPLLQVTCDRLPGDAEGLSSQPTLSRFENAVEPRAVRELLTRFEKQWVDSLPRRRKLVLLDIDGTDDPTHGAQQLTFFHGFYDQYMYHPLLIFDAVDGALASAVLRPGNTHACRGAVGVLDRIIRAVRARCPRARIVVRADSGFAMPRLLVRLEALNDELGNVDYVIGLAKNPVLLRRAERWTKQAQRRFEKTPGHVRVFGEFRYAAETWTRRRRVIVKAEHLPKGANPRFVTTTMAELGNEEAYDFYCGRGETENRVKDLKNALSGDRLSCCRFSTNFFRLLLHSAAYRLMHALRRRLGRIDAELGKSQLDTLRLRLIKVAALVSQSVRRIHVRLPASFPLMETFQKLAQARAAPD